jgi:hypothetical protein|tara:strand:+ start:1059 stop:1319 length:261 start_codon:yes stop_codon:yes gene_type:complete
MSICCGTLIQNKLTNEIGVVLDIKVWKKDGYKLTRKLSNKIFSSRYFPSTIRNKTSNSIDFYVHWASGARSWIISSGVIIVEKPTN